VTAEAQPRGIVELDHAGLPMDVDRGRAWEIVRKAGPVVRIGEGLPLITRREDVVEALRDSELFSSKEAFEVLGSPLPLVPIAFDPPEHTRYRKVLQPFFSPRALSRMMPSLQSQALALIDELAERGSCDAVADLAVPYPSQVFLTLFGLPLDDRERLLAWKDAVIDLAMEPSSPDSDLTAAMELFGYVNEFVGARRQSPRDDLLSDLLHAEDGLNDQEAVGLSFLFVLAGLDTVTAAIGFALWKLAVNPELRARLRGDGEKIGEFIEEMIRLEPPVPYVPRVVTRDHEFGGVTVPAGTLVHLCLGSANREDAEGVLPLEPQLDGETRRHWGFGGGAHRCLGSHLARMELRLVLTNWLAKIPDFELAQGFDPRMPYPANTFQFFSLPLVYPPR
jgi:hypothetical protein